MPTNLGHLRLHVNVSVNENANINANVNGLLGRAHAYLFSIVRDRKLGDNNTKKVLVVSRY